MSKYISMVDDRPNIGDTVSLYTFDKDNEIVNSFENVEIRYFEENDNIGFMVGGVFFILNKLGGNWKFKRHNKVTSELPDIKDKGYYVNDSGILMRLSGIQNDTYKNELILEASGRNEFSLSERSEAEIFIMVNAPWRKLNEVSQTITEAFKKGATGVVGSEDKTVLSNSTINLMFEGSVIKNCFVTASKSKISLDKNALVVGVSNNVWRDLSEFAEWSFEVVSEGVMLPALDRNGYYCDEDGKMMSIKISDDGTPIISLNNDHDEYGEKIDLSNLDKFFKEYTEWKPLT